MNNDAWDTELPLYCIHLAAKTARGGSSATNDVALGRAAGHVRGEGAEGFGSNIVIAYMLYSWYLTSIFGTW